MIKLLWLPEARDDIQRLFDFLVAVNPSAAARVVRLIQRGAERIREQPELGRPMEDPPSLRELFLPFGASAYVIRYRIEEQAIVVIRIWHGRERRE